MISRKQRIGRWSIALLATVSLLALAPAAWGQATTGSLSGRVVSQSDQSLLPGVEVEAIHTPTGTRYTTVTQDNGRFNLLNVRVGGPYAVKATLAGFGEAQLDDVFVALGETRDLKLEMRLEAVAETIEVTTEATPLITPDRMGSSSAVTLESIESLPTVRRQIQDLARTNPYFTSDPADGGGTRLSVAGKNNRYNTVQIDGAVNNDLFGLADTGTPGGQADTQPISLDAIQELQLVISPYDVRQGGFTGGGINAITRSGSNKYNGSFYGSQRDESLVGDGPFDRPVATFSEDQYGLRFGGPILKDRLFFFTSAEMNRREAPTGVAADGSAPTNFNKPADAARFRDVLRTRYNYDPGELGDFPSTTDSDLGFLRFDFNLAASHQATLRHNYVKAARDVVSDRSASRFRFPTSIYALADKTNSSVFQLNSVFGSGAFNEGRIGYQTIRDVRSVPVIFPSIEIGTTNQQPEMAAGTERFSGANSLDQDVLEVTDDFTFIKGNHTVTVGTHNEFFDFKNLFLSEFYGYYRFTTLADFEKGIAQDYRISFANGADPRRPTTFSVQQYGLYAGDQWRINDAFTLTFGVRADYPQLNDKPSYNPAVDATFGVNTSKVPTNNLTISPRLGFNWALGKEVRQQLRGGVGVFAGRTPYVWVSNAYGGTGVETTALFVRNQPFNPDPNAQPRNFPPGTGAVSVDTVDPDFEFPRVLRATLGYDRELPFGIRGVIEAMYTMTQKDIYYQNINKIDSGTRAFDGRPIYKNRSTSFADVTYLTDTGKGEQLNMSVQFEKRFKFGTYINTSYAYMEAKSAFDSTSSRAVSSWRFMPTRGDIYAHELSRTNWEVRDRINAMVSQDWATGPLRHNVSLFYTVQSGTPYSVLMGGDINGDGSTSNDLIYVPNDASEIILKGVTWEQFDAFIVSAGLDKYRGQVAPRNASFAPWNRTLDFHYDIELPIKVVRVKLTADVLNLINLIDSSKWTVKYVSNQTYTPVSYSKDAATGKPVYTVSNVAAVTPGNQWTGAESLRTRWQAKFGLRLSF